MNNSTGTILMLKDTVQSTTKTTGTLLSS